MSQEKEQWSPKSSSGGIKRNGQTSSKWEEVTDEKHHKRQSPLSDRSKSPVEKSQRRYRSHNSKRSVSHSPKRDERATLKDSVSLSEIKACHCLGVFGLSSDTDEKDLTEIFSHYGDIDKLCLVYDKQSGHSKGFGFVYFRRTADATKARKETQGLILDGRRIRVDYSLTLEPHQQEHRRDTSRQRSSNNFSSPRYRPRHSHEYRPHYQRRSSFFDYERRSRPYRDDYDVSYNRGTSRRYSAPYYRRY